jgi:hypothetical protein
MHPKLWLEVRVNRPIAPSILRSDLALKGARRHGGSGGWLRHKPTAARPVPEIRPGLGAAVGACYRGGTWFESTAAHHINEHEEEEEEATRG